MRSTTAWRVSAFWIGPSWAPATFKMRGMQRLLEWNSRTGETLTQHAHGRVLLPE